MDTWKRDGQHGNGMVLAGYELRNQCQRYYNIYFEVYFFAFKLVFWPVQRGSGAGSSRNESDYVLSPEVAQNSLPLLPERRSCDNFGRLD